MGAGSGGRVSGAGGMLAVRREVLESSVLHTIEVIADRARRAIRDGTEDDHLDALRRIATQATSEVRQMEQQIEIERLRDLARRKMQVEIASGKRIESEFSFIANNVGAFSNMPPEMLLIAEREIEAAEKKIMQRK